MKRQYIKPLLTVIRIESDNVMLVYSAGFTLDNLYDRDADLMEFGDELEEGELWD